MYLCNLQLNILIIIHLSLIYSSLGKNLNITMIRMKLSLCDASVEQTRLKKIIH